MNNYPYYNPYGYQQQPYIPQQQSYINGKIVDSEDIARIQEVPINSYGVFPKADMTAIYVKSWKSDGTTKLITYLPIIEEEKATEEVSLNEIYSAIIELNQKIAGSTKTATVPMTRSKVKKEVADE